MAASSKTGTPAVGFLTVIEVAGQGLFGGYLVLNISGRPLEFQCTAPVKANRAQEILYGLALKPYLFGERIGQALLEKSKIEPLLVFTDVEPVLAVREFSPTPVVLIDDAPANASDSGRLGGERRMDAAHPQRPPPLSRLHTFELGGRRMHVPPTHESDQARIVECWTRHSAEFDVLEPFGRIREAIQEALSGAE